MRHRKSLHNCVNLNDRNSFAQIYRVYWYFYVSRDYSSDITRHFILWTARRLYVNLYIVNIYRRKEIITSDTHMIVAVGMQHRFVVSESVKLRLNVGDLSFNEYVHPKWNLNLNLITFKIIAFNQKCRDNQKWHNSPSICTCLIRLS